MRKFFAATLLLALLALLAGIFAGPRLWAQVGGAVKRKPPPKTFDKRVEEAFLKDVVKHHGDGTINDVLAGRATVSVPGVGVGDPGSTPAAGNANSGWSKIISAETLENEIKAVINVVGPEVASNTKWKTGHRKVRNYYTTLAMCFGVIAQYDGTVKFQKDAVALRDNLGKSAANSKVDTPGALAEAKRLLAELQELRSGGKTTLAPSGEDARPYGVSEVAEVMKRIQIATKPEGVDGKGLEFWTSSAGAFKAAKSEVIHEAELMAMMSKVLQNPQSFEQFAGDPEFDKFARAMQDASTEIVAAAKSDNYDMARAAVGKITKACAGCHGAFKG